MEDLYKLTVPPAFALDHASRDLPTGKLIKATRRGSTFMVTMDELLEWRDDADFYAHACWGGLADDLASYFGLICSARATVKRCDKVINSIKETA